MTYAYLIGASWYCPTCVDTVGELAQAKAEAITDPEDLYDREQVGDPLETVTTYKYCANCDERLYRDET